MNEIKKLRAEDDSSSFDRLPEDISFHIINKLIDLKTLCLCKLVSRRFSSIVSQVEAISFTFSTYPLVDTTTSLRPCGSLMKFLYVKSLCIQLPSSFDNQSLFKWKFNFKLSSFVVLSPNSVCKNKGLNANENGQEAAEEEEDIELSKKKANIMWECFKDAVVRVMLLLHAARLPLLETVVITDLGKRGKVSFSLGKVDDLKRWISLVSHVPVISKCYIPLLKLPASGYVMKGVKLYLLQWNDPSNDSHDNLMKSDDNDDFEDEEEAAYSEAMMKVLNKHRDRMVGLYH